MRPSPAVLEKLARTLDALLAGTTVDKLWRPGAWQLLFDLRALGKSRLLVEADARHPRAVVTARWPETPAAPDRETLVLRKLLEGIRIRAVRAEDERRLVFAFQPRHDAELRLVVQLAGRYPNAAVFDQTGAELVRLIADRPAVDDDSPPLPKGGADADPHPELEGRAWLDAYAEATWQDADQRALDAERATLVRMARGALEKVRALVRKHLDDLTRAAEAEALRHRGDLLKTVLGRIPKGAESIEVSDWADPEQRPVTLALDPQLSPVENLERLFARYRKLVRTAAEAEQRLEAAWAREELLAALLAELEVATDLAPFPARLTELGIRRSSQAVRAEAGDAIERLPYRPFAAADGTAILVGRSAKDNDALTFRVASGKDIFLHARDVSGSHVILKGSGRPPSHEALLDAATLAAWHSSARGEAVIDVLWTEKKHVRRVPGAAPGRVTTAEARNLAIRVDPARLERLYAGVPPP
ncbi:MAG: NFACT RNA binding domain-containing protein [Myxococcota bacterium]